MPVDKKIALIEDGSTDQVERSWQRSFPRGSVDEFDSSWIIDVLDDLAAFAEHQKERDIEDELNRARHKIKRILSDRSR